MVSATRTLIVRFKIRIEVSPSNLEVNKEADAKFMCAATTDSMEVNNLQITWLKDDKVIDIDEERVIQNYKTGSLTIRNVTRNDVGRYTCVATNGLNVVNASALLTIKVTGTQPPVMLINLPAQVLFKESEIVALPCKASGEPQPT
ncbi:peroxidasin homolog, partial [Octopus bimaculoides]|uniref:Ig-like domain-containing protein n=1 Tax=Octopus bimaculoides TaxID=37653 RepID=A0A0L8FFA6_OCTBM|eukprot:XP_014790332.1 PREDICTED: peroxidasin homolog [Octopus bimaculoides]